MPTHKYKGVVYERPKNISNAMCKQIIDSLGGDYTFTINSVLDVIDKLSSSEIAVSDVTTTIQFMEPGQIICPSKMSDLYEHSAE